jgi:hypothetical protein
MAGGFHLQQAAAAAARGRGVSVGTRNITGSERIRLMSVFIISHASTLCSLAKPHVQLAILHQSNHTAHAPTRNNINGTCRTDQRSQTHNHTRHTKQIALFRTAEKLSSPAPTVWRPADLLSLNIPVHHDRQHILLAYTNHLTACHTGQDHHVPAMVLTTEGCCETQIQTRTHDLMQ